MIGQLSSGDATAIMRAAKWFAGRCGMHEDDLRQETFARLLAGKRHVRRNFDFAREVGGIIQSIAWEEIKLVKAGRREVRPTPDGISAPALVDPSPSPEALAASSRDDAAMLSEIGRLIDGDEQLQLLVEGICDKMRGEELQKLLDVDVKGLDTVRKRLRRRLQGAFPKGLGL
ncbi:MAG: hypothetical protein EPO45_11015 [Sphingobium sp.]|nr:hypothetical protein [Alphaproteobacteria bacterium]TAJ76663.1 MAG: hypothetical protein EPO45_11015 [Sphingobium sp.]